ncbi:unnamed protein product [Withania somnifera]
MRLWRLHTPRFFPLPRHQHFPKPNPPSKTIINTWYFKNHPLMLLIDKCHSIKQLKQIRTHMLRIELFFHPFSASKLIEYAHKLFDRIPQPNLFSSNALIRAYSSSQESILLIFVNMICEGYEFLVNLLTHLEGVGVDIFVLNSLIHFYADCGCLSAGYLVFESMQIRNAVSWNTMILGSAEGVFADEALKMFYRMGEENVRPNDYTMIGVLSACGKKLDLELGRWVHAIEEAERLSDKMGEKDTVSWTTMLVGFARVGNFVAARSALDMMPNQDIAAWNALISAYEQSGKTKEALAVFNEFQLIKKAEPDEVTLVCAQSACAQLGAIDLGRQNCHLTTALFDMYSKCGDVDKALEMFDSVNIRDVFFVFLKIQEHKVKPNSVTLINVLCACRHSGLVEEGWAIFNQMENVYGIVPGVKHYACLVDILGHAGELGKAEELINNMPVAPGPSVWGAPLGACRLHGYLALAEQACNRLLELEPENQGSMLRKRMKDCGLKKEPGCSSIEVNCIVHEFLVGHNSHPSVAEIYAKLDEIAARLKHVGYVSNKSQILRFLAMAFGLISMAPSQPIRIMKNLCVCGDCHAVAKLNPKLYNREILLRDRYRFHHFKEGNCSCRDYW